MTTPEKSVEVQYRLELQKIPHPADRSRMRKIVSKLLQAERQKREEVRDNCIEEYRNNLLAHLNDYDNPIMMTAEQVRES